MADIKNRTDQTADRWEQRAKERRRREWNLSRLDNTGNALAVEDPGRLLKRMQDDGMSVEEAAQALAVQEDGSDAAPINKFLERIIDDSELVGVEFLLRGAMLTRAVGRVVIKSPSGSVLGFGTGFMVTPRVMMTNNHVLGDVGDALHSTIQFNHIQRNGRLGPVEEFGLKPNLFFATDAPLDFSVVAVDQSSTTGSQLNRPWAPLVAESGKALVGESINIIQHPAGRPQEATLRENRVVDVFDTFLHYSSDTEQGSSGAPAFNDHWELAALHHSGVPDKDDNGNILLEDGSVWNGSADQIPLIKWVANEGIRISSIVANLRATVDERAGQPRDYLEELLDAARPSERDAAPSPEADPSSDVPGPGGISGRVDESGRVHWIVPLEVTAQLGAGGAAAVTATPAPAPSSAPTAPTAPPDPVAVDTARATLTQAETGDYYDEGADA
ncbi:MAG: trypsin-like serine peptidase, partial [Ilumatobacteraceae bacterium]